MGDPRENKTKIKIKIRTSLVRLFVVSKKTINGIKQKNPHQNIKNIKNITDQKKTKTNNTKKISPTLHYIILESHCL